MNERDFFVDLRFIMTKKDVDKCVGMFMVKTQKVILSKSLHPPTSVDKHVDL